MTEVKSQMSNRMPKGPSAKKASQTKVASEFAALLKQARDVKTVETPEEAGEVKDALSSGTLARVKNISKERRTAKHIQDNYDDSQRQSRYGSRDVQETDSSNDTGEELEDDETSYESLKKAPVENNASQDKKLAAEFSKLLAQARTSKKAESSASEDDVLDEKEVMSKGTVARVKHISNMRRINSIKVKDDKHKTEEKKNKEQEKHSEKSSMIRKDDQLLKPAAISSEKIIKNEQNTKKENPYENVLKKRTAPKVPGISESKNSHIINDKIDTQQVVESNEIVNKTNDKTKKEENVSMSPKTASKKRAAPRTPEPSKPPQSPIEIERIALRKLLKNTETKDEKLGDENNTPETDTKKTPPQSPIEIEKIALRKLQKNTDTKKEKNIKDVKLEDTNITPESEKNKMAAPKLAELNKLQPTTSLRKSTPQQIKQNNDTNKQVTDSVSNPVAEFKRISLKKSPAPKLPNPNKLPDKDTVHQNQEKRDTVKQKVETASNPINNFKITSLKETPPASQFKERIDQDKQEDDTLPNPAVNLKIASLKKTSPLQNKENSAIDEQNFNNLSNPVTNSKTIKQTNNESADKNSSSINEHQSSKASFDLHSGINMAKDENESRNGTEVVLRPYNKKNEYYLIKEEKPTELEEHMKLIQSRRASEDLRGFNMKKIMKQEKRRNSLEEIFNPKIDKETGPKELDVNSRIIVESSREVQRKALKELHNQARHHTHPECAYGNMIPEPDYSDDEQAEANTKTSSAIVNRNNTFNNAISKDPLQDRFDEKGLIIPKKLVNPNLEATEKKNLHRELKFNAKAGVNVLNQKSELQKVLEKQKDKKAVKELEAQRQEELTPLQKAMHERAQKIEKESEKTDNKNSENDKNSSEFEKVHAKLRGKMEV